MSYWEFANRVTILQKRDNNITCSISHALLADEAIM